jgi:DnaJ-class molecular chaperone
MGILYESLLRWKAKESENCKHCKGTGLGEYKLMKKDEWQRVFTKCDKCKGTGVQGQR